MRIIIELDTTSQPEVQVGTQTYTSLNKLQTPSSTGNAVDAGEPKVGAMQGQSMQQEQGSGYYDQQTTGIPSAGAAPQNIN